MKKPSTIKPGTLSKWIVFAKINCKASRIIHFDLHPTESLPVKLQKIKNKCEVDISTVYLYPVFATVENPSYQESIYLN